MKKEKKSKNLFITKLKIKFWNMLEIIEGMDTAFLVMFCVTLPLNKRKILSIQVNILMKLKINTGMLLLEILGFHLSTVPCKSFFK